MTISVDLTDDQMKVMLMYAETKSMTIADLIENIVERIEDELDTADADKAFEEFYKDPQTVTFEEAMKELGLK
jgi:Mg2+/Co2+ transporter CorC